MSFLNFSSAFETLFESNDAESDVSAVSKLSVIEKVDESSINFF